MPTFTLGGTNAQILPKNISNEIWGLAVEESVIGQLTTQTPLILGDNVFPTLTQRPSASIVGEGQPKPGSNIGLGAKVIRPIKAVVGLEFTEEAIEADPAGILGLIQTELGSALRRQIDLAVFHGRDATSGAALTGAEYVNQTTNRVELTTPTQSDVEIWAGYGLLANAGKDFSGFAMDPRFVYRLASARDANGNRMNPDLNIGDSVTAYSGQRVVVGKTVSGQVDGSADTNVRAFAGDWDALRFGYNQTINLRTIPYGDPFGNGDLAARNARAYLAEVRFGWGFMDLAAFVAYEDAVV